MHLHSSFAGAVGAMVIRERHPDRLLAERLRLGAARGRVGSPAAVPDGGAQACRRVTEVGAVSESEAELAASSARGG